MKNFVVNVLIFFVLKKDNSFYEEFVRINSCNRKSDVKLVIKMW